MSKFKASVLAAAVLFGAAVTADAFAQRHRGGGHGARHHHHGGHHHGGHHRHRGGVSLGFAIGSPFWYGSPYPYYRPYYRPYYYPYPVAVGAPAATEYIEQAQPAPSAAAPATGYWYYCHESQAYYPHVQQCAGQWERVAPQPPS